MPERPLIGQLRAGRERLAVRGVRGGAGQRRRPRRDPATCAVKSMPGAPSAGGARRPGARWHACLRAQRRDAVTLDEAYARLRRRSRALRQAANFYYGIRLLEPPPPGEQ